MGNGHPRFFGWVNSPPAPVGVVGGPPGGGPQPELRRRRPRGDLRRARGRPLADGARRLPVEGSMGLLVSGGLHGLAHVPRRRPAPRGRPPTAGTSARADCASAPAPLVLYLSEEGHSCMRKAAEVLGLGRDAVRTVPVDGDFRMDVRALRAAVAADRAAGRRPFCVAASAGTVNTGAIDPLDERGRPLPGRGPLVPRRRRVRRHRRRGPGPRRRATRGSSARTRWRSTRTSGSRCRWSAAARSSGTGASSGTRGASCRPTSGPRRARASGASPGTRSTASSRRGASGRSSSG